MGTAAKSKKNGTNDSNPENMIDPATQLHEIQKLLFGQQISQLESVIAELKSDLSTQLSQMEKQFSQSLDKQKKDFSSQLSELSKHLNDVDGQHNNREALLEDDLDTLRRSLESFEAQTESAHDSLEKQLLSESQKLSEELSAKHDEAIEKLRSSSTTLDDKKVDRASLADLLTSVAQTIQSQA